MPEAERNGVIIGYEVRESGSDGVTTVNGTDVIYARLSLSRNVSHWLSISAFTDVGRSPSASVYVHSRDDNKGQ